jgi:hypothetical protein
MDMASHDGQRIEHWGVMGEGRLTGTVYNRPGHRDGGMIVTSPVVEIRIMGTGAWPGTYPVAFTESGNAYRLGRPAPSFGIENAQKFIYARLNSDSAPRPSSRRPDGSSPDRTLVRAALDMSFQHVERIELDATTFDPTWQE